jgi:prephenate dehydrogenase
MKTPTVGIIGFGTFGRFMAEQLSLHLPVRMSSRSANPETVAQTGARLASFEDVAAADYVIPSVPVQDLAGVLEKLAPLVGSHTTVVDVSSVKVVPVQLMERILPNDCQILATHPLFGPQSGANGIAGLPMVIWPVRMPEGRVERVRAFLRDTLKLNVIDMSPEEHDREMAYVQALTFLLGQAFSEIDIPDTPLKTKTYQHLLDVRRVVENDTPELFETIQHYNPYAAEMRERFVRKLDEIEEAELERTNPGL